MDMSVKVPSTKIGGFIKLSDSSYKTSIANSIKKHVVGRTKSGTDINGHSFAPYSKTYAKKNGSNVDISKSGRLLGSLRVDIKGDNIDVYPTQHTSIGYSINNGTDGQPKREWLGVTDSFANELKKDIDKIYSNSIRDGKKR